MSDGYVHLNLTLDEVRVACYHGVDRRMKKLNGERGDRPQSDRSTWDNELEGSCTELALNKYYGLYPTSLAGLRAPDSLEWEIRWTNWYDSGGLLIYPDDANDRRYLLLDGFAPNYRIIGWAFGREAKQRDHFIRDGGYYILPRRLLHPYSKETRS